MSYLWSERCLTDPNFKLRKFIKMIRFLHAVREISV